MSSAISARPSGVYLFNANGIPRLTAFEVEFGYDAVGIHGWMIRQDIDSFRRNLQADSNLQPDAKRLAIDMLDLMNFRRFVTSPATLLMICFLLLLVGIVFAARGSTAGYIMLGVAVVWGAIVLITAWYTATRLEEISLRERNLSAAFVNQL
jgi:hypothetical protein